MVQKRLRAAEEDQEEDATRKAAAGNLEDRDDEPTKPVQRKALVRVSSDLDSSGLTFALTSFALKRSAKRQGNFVWFSFYILLYGVGT